MEDEKIIVDNSQIRDIVTEDKKDKKKTKDINNDRIS